MAFRSSEYLQRNELVRYQLDDVILYVHQETINIKSKMAINLQ